jgi:hypothetical protein
MSSPQTVDNRPGIKELDRSGIGFASQKISGPVRKRNTEGVRQLKGAARCWFLAGAPDETCCDPETPVQAMI